MAVLNKIKHVIDKIFEVISTIILAVMTVLVVYQVITRYVFNAPSAISEILSQYLFVWMIMFGSAYVYGSREHLTRSSLILSCSFSSPLYVSTAVISIP